MEQDLASLRARLATVLDGKSFHCPRGAAPVRQLPTSYPIGVWNTKPTLEDIDLGGLTYVSGADFVQLTPSHRVASTIVVDRMFVLNAGDRRRTLYHFLHELAHTVTLHWVMETRGSGSRVGSRFQFKVPVDGVMRSLLAKNIRV